ncbi:hypothetical protein [Flavivirga sp. 57AJ16]|uniref:helix-turn-helix transcriptional regulator n=1 Tax=Flavivirga sp. 57AJ16 TaxID=3025307 RepID=UPI0023668B8A|nr:hypothetical protein [Flavivirga sp. 57AJ16]MDD7887968.1 hypothetical protein [Flavivirga sp. 57AJ16]
MRKKTHIYNSRLRSLKSKTNLKFYLTKKCNLFSFLVFRPFAQEHTIFEFLYKLKRPISPKFAAKNLDVFIPEQRKFTNVDTTIRGIEEPNIILMMILLFVIIFLLLKEKRHNEIKKKHATMKLQISLAEQYIEKEKFKKNQMKDELEFKNKQLTSYAFSYEQKNRIIESLQEIVKKIENSKTNFDKIKYVKELKVVAKENLIADKNWECFRSFFEETQHGFHAKILSKHPNLKANDLKLCSVIRLNLTIKETAQVLGISPGSLKTSRYRLRKKLDLPAGENILDYLISLEL